MKLVSRRAILAMLAALTLLIAGCVPGGRPLFTVPPKIAEALAAEISPALATETPTPTPAPIPTEKPVTFVPYKDTNTLLDFEYPDYWKMKSVTSESAPELAVSTPKEDAVFAMTAAGFSPIKSLNDYAEDQLMQIAPGMWENEKTVLAGKVDLAGDPSISVVTIDGEKFLKYQMDCTVKETQDDYRLYLSIGFHNNKTYVFMYLLAADAAPVLQEYLDRIIASIRFQEAA